MATLTLDEIEYETDNFNDLQNQIVGEIQYNNNLQTQLDYQLQSLRSMGESLVVRLKEELTETTKTESE